MTPPTVAPDEEALRDWVARTVRGRIVSWERLTVGNSRSLWAADVARSGGTGTHTAVVVRVDAGDGPLSGTELTVSREVTAYRALAGSAIRAPRLVGVDPEHGVMVLTRVPGTSDWMDTALDGLLAELGRLHRVDAERLELPGFARHARDDLELWARIAATRIAAPVPVVDLAISMLRDRFPGEPDRLVLCHGDAGPGNVLHDAGAVTGLLDWEFAHLGDPADDLAWVTVRAVLYGIDLPDFAERVRASYEPVAGQAADQRRLAYWQAVVLLRNLITCYAGVANPVPGRDRLVHFMLIPPLERLVIDALAELEGIRLAPTRSPSGPDDLPGGDVLRAVASGFDDLLPALADPEARTRAKRMRLLLGQLAHTWTLAFDIARAELADADPAPDLPGRLQQLADAAERRLALFPRAVPIARATLPRLEEGPP